MSGIYSGKLIKDTVAACFGYTTIEFLARLSMEDWQVERLAKSGI